MTKAKGINPTSNDIGSNRRVVLRDNEDRGVFIVELEVHSLQVALAIAGQELLWEECFELLQDSSIKTEQALYCFVKYNSDQNVCQSLKSDLTWEDEWIEE